MCSGSGLTGDRLERIMEGGITRGFKAACKQQGKKEFVQVNFEEALAKRGMSPFFPAEVCLRLICRSCPSIGTGFDAQAWPAIPAVMEEATKLKYLKKARPNDSKFNPFVFADLKK